MIEARCPPLFAVAIKDRGKKGHLTTLKSDEKLVDIRSLSLVLEYLYTGSVPFSDVSPAEVISLIAHTELYQIDRLRWLCERYLQAVLTDDLFFTLLLVSDVSGVARAKTLCMQYGATNFEKLIVKKEHVATLGIELFREFVVFSTLNNEVLEDISQLSFPNTIRDEFKIIFTAMANPDAFFAFKSANTTIPCHRAILFAQSDKFKTLFLDEVNQSPSDGRYTLPKPLAMPPDAFKSFLAWAYYRDTTFSAAHAAMMLPLAHEFGITALIDECDGKLRKGISVQSVIPIMVLCWSEWGKKSYKQELAQPCLDFLILNFARVDLSTPRSAAINAAIAEAVRNAVINGIWQPVDGSSAPTTPSSSVAPVSPHVTQSATTDSEAQDSDAEDKKHRKRKHRKTTELELQNANTEDSTTDSVSTPKAKRKSKVLSESSSDITGAHDEKAEAAAPSTAAQESTEKSVDEAKKIDNPKEEAKNVESESNVVANGDKPAAVEEVEKPSHKNADVAPVSAVPALAALEAQGGSGSASGSPKVFRRQGSVQPSKASPKSSSKSDKSDKSDKSETKEAKAESKSEAKSEVKTDTLDAAELKVERKEVSPSTAEKRAALVPSTSVKAIKESFEAKNKEDLAEKEAANNRAARRRSVKLDALDSSGSDQGAKRVK